MSSLVPKMGAKENIINIMEQVAGALPTAPFMPVTPSMIIEKTSELPAEVSAVLHNSNPTERNLLIDRASDRLVENGNKEGVLRRRLYVCKLSRFLLLLATLIASCATTLLFDLVSKDSSWILKIEKYQGIATIVFMGSVMFLNAKIAAMSVKRADLQKTILIDRYVSHIKTLGKRQLLQTMRSDAQLRYGDG